MSLICDLCGKEMKVVPGVLSFNTLHECITGTEIVCMYDVNDECVYCGLPPELETLEGHKVQEFCKSFVKKETSAKNPYLIRALRNNAVTKIIDVMFTD